MGLFRSRKLSGGAASRAEVYGLFFASFVLLGGGIGGAFALTANNTAGQEQSTRVATIAVSETPLPSVAATASATETGSSNQNEAETSAEPIENPETTGGEQPIDCYSLPQLPNDNGGEPVASIDLPEADENFPDSHGLRLDQLGCKIAEAHGYWGDSYSVGISYDGVSNLMWYSNQVDTDTVMDVLRNIGAVN